MIIRMIIVLEQVVYAYILTIWLKSGGSQLEANCGKYFKRPLSPK
jgi:hypothetical protein